MNKNGNKYITFLSRGFSTRTMLVRYFRESRLALRLTALLLMTTLLAPVIFFNPSPMIAAASSFSASSLSNLSASAPIAAPPEMFAAPSSFSSIYDNAFIGGAISTTTAASGKIAKGYESAANVISPPALPEGFENAVLPTFTERIAHAFSSSAPASSLHTDQTSPATAEFAEVAENKSTSPLVYKNSTEKITAEETVTNDTDGNVLTDAETGSETNLEPLAPAPPPPPTSPGIANFDFNGDGKADVARFQTSSNLWTVKNSNGGGTTTATLGTIGSIIVPADYDGDGIADRAVWNQYSADWTILKSSNNQTATISAFGASGDIPVPADYSGTSASEVAFFRPSNGTWYFYRLSDGQATSTQWGQAGDIPLPGDYNNDGKADLAVFRPSNGVWYILVPGNGGSYNYFQWGAGTDVPVPADYDGDGKTDYAVYRPANGTWYIQPMSGATYISKTWGNYGDQPVPADYDGDGKADIAVWRPTSGVWYIVKSSVAGLTTYVYDQLGIPGDTAASSAYVKKVGGTAPPAYLAMARLSPKNATGGTDLYSRNLSWGTGLVNLPGRAGLNAGFGISYNSLVWTKEPLTNTMVFDADYSNVSPGFRFGFPVIEPSYYNPLTQQFSYLMVTPSGRRVEFRQTAASNVYETADSSYAQLTVIPGQQNQGTEYTTLLVRTTDGTMMTYVWRAGSYKLSEIKDRNGNFISVVHDSQYGLLQSITDTLGRVVTVEYDSDFSPIAIKQEWKDNNGAGSTVSHTYATFTYTAKQVEPHFGSLNVFGPTGGAYVKVLEQIVYPTGARTVFEYDNKYAQVSKISNRTVNNTILNYVETDLKRPSNDQEVQSDCLRFSTTRDWVKDFNNEAETVIHNTFSGNQTYAAGGESLGALDMTEVWMDNDPHTVHSKSYYYPAGNWAEGLPLGTIDSADNAQQRWTRTIWTQDDTNKNYQVNPRITESKVGDNTNTKRTAVNYHLQAGSTTVSQFGLVKEVRVFDTDQTTVLKKTVTDYNLTQTYLDCRIVGLPSERKLYEGESGLMSKVTYAYDGDNFSDTNLQQNLTSVIRHDNTNYGSNFTNGRGNLTSTTRYDITGQTANATSLVKYDTAGNVAANIDPLGRIIKISYEDSFNDTTATRNTFAYPTKLTDPAGYYSEIKYRFDVGANVRAKSPTPEGNTYGKVTTRLFDTVGRLEKESLWKDNQEYSYTRHDYTNSDRATHSRVFSTLTDTNSNEVGDAADEVLYETFTDGAGRVIKSRTPHSFDVSGNTATWAGQKVVYDILGQVVQQSLPTEIDASWNAAGDDATRGFLWTSAEYDWKGRTTRTVNTDGTDSLINYDGCGCAGGQVATIKGVSVPVPGQTNTYARRTRKIYEDILGRDYKTEDLNWDGSIYSTIKTAFNGRDQATSITQFAGTDTSSIYQITTQTYDGHGRLKTTHLPDQDAAAATTYNYYPDDAISSVVDGRGAATNYTYNNRGQLDLIHYTVPLNSNIPMIADVSFNYDALGNRLNMIDGLGRVDYEYSWLSQLKAETRQFTDSLPDAPVSGNKYKIEYSYTLNGRLKSLKDPFSYQNDYSFDKIGHNISVNGSGYGDLPSTQATVSGMQYRAFGSMKQANYGNGTQATMQYNNRLQPAGYRLTNTSNNQILNGRDYIYTTGTNNDNDGLIKKSILYNDAATSSQLGKSTRTNTYDAIGRIRTSAAGEYGATPFGQSYTNGAFQQSYSYDAFGNQQGFGDRDFEKNVIGCVGCPRSLSNQTTVINNRVTQSSSYTDGYGTTISNYQYDADGRLTVRSNSTYQYDAAGRRAFDTTSSPASSTAYVYDGDGKVVKLSENGAVKNYYLISSILNTTIADLTNTGSMETGYMLAPEGGRIASRKDNEVKFFNYDLSGIGYGSFKMDKTAGGGETYDGWGQKVVYGGYTGGGPCGNNCPGGYTPPSNMGALNEFENMRLSQRWQDSVFWNLQSYINAGIVVGNTPPAGWDPYIANINRISSGAAFNPPWTNFGPTAGYGLFREGSSLTRGFQNWSSQTQDAKLPDLKDVVKQAEELLKNDDCRALFDKIGDPRGVLSEMLERGLINYRDVKPEVDPESLTVKGLEGARVKSKVLSVEVNVPLLSLAVPYDDTSPKTMTLTFQGAEILVNSNGLSPFLMGFRLAKNLPQEIKDLPIEKQRSLSLLHELGHVMDLLYGKDGSKIEGDSGNTPLSEKNTILVYEACLKGK